MILAAVPDNAFRRLSSSCHVVDSGTFNILWVYQKKENLNFKHWMNARLTTCPPPTPLPPSRKAIFLHRRVPIGNSIR